MERMEHNFLEIFLHSGAICSLKITFGLEQVKNQQF